jgi:putative membrane protein
VEVALVWIVLAVCSTIVLVARTVTRRELGKGSVSPEELLARRYAAGEIDETEYLTRLSFLKDANELAP